MKKILLVVLFITIAVSFYSCKDKRDLSPSGFSDTQMSAIYVEKAGSASLQGTSPSCSEYWFEGSPKAITEAKKFTTELTVILGAKIVPSCKEYRIKATCACKSEIDCSNDKQTQRMFPGIKKMFTIQYYLGKDIASAKRMCKSDKKEKATFIEF